MPEHKLSKNLRFRRPGQPNKVRQADVVYPYRLAADYARVGRCAEARGLLAKALRLRRRLVRLDPIFENELRAARQTVHESCPRRT